MTKQQGFSLLEVLIAFAILALALSLLLRIFSGGVNTAIVSDGYTTAVQIAESLMAKTGVETPLQEGRSTGREYDTYDWTVTVGPFQVTDIPEQSLPANVELMEVRVEVSWQEGEAEPRQVRLTTLKLVNTGT